mmetsp:Transcript_32641/g.60692  ORF Transcript_32641/g.60692 Transcript_32641/m.60692 type:complete len:221 (+) Transcript_32641:970-1632(+)
MEAIRVVVRNEIRSHLPTNHLGVVTKGAEEGEVMAKTADPVGVQSCAHFRKGFISVLAVSAEFGNHWVVEHGNLRTLSDARIHAHVFSDRLLIGGEKTRRRQKLTVGVLSIHARLNRPSVDADVILGKGKLLPCCNLDHLLDDVDLRNHLGDRVLNLKACVHLQEVKVLLLVHQKLHRSCTLVLDGFGELEGLGSHFRPDFRGRERRRSLLQDLLVPPLN